MDESELKMIVDAILHRKSYGGLRPHELLASIQRRKLPATMLPVIEPLLRTTDGMAYKYAITVVGKMKGASTEASDAVEAAWDDSWFEGVPQACTEAFQALLRIGGNDRRLLAMIERAMQVDNYGIHKECAETLMRIDGGDVMLKHWGATIAGRCDCHLHRKLAEKIVRHLNAPTTRQT